MEKIRRNGNEMLTAMDKGIEAAQVVTPPVGVYQGVDLRIIPKYVSFKAAMLKEKLTLQYVLAIHVAFFVLLFFSSRFEIHSLEKKLREKEYILAPGVMDFTPASAQTVSDSYVVNAAMSFLSMFGNVNATNVDEQYKRLADFMSPQLRIQFMDEISEWKETIKNENISEIIRVTDREVVGTDDGFYKFTALTQRERYSNSENLGHVDEVVEMVLRLVPPTKGKEWYLEIESMNRSRADGFRYRDKANSKPTSKGNEVSQ